MRRPYVIVLAFALGSCAYAPGHVGQCVSGLSVCAAECVDTNSDPAHCGACSNPCGVGLACREGVCTPSCAAPLRSCGVGSASTCTDLGNDSANCGACGLACGAGETCLLGTCRVGCAGGGWRMCGGSCRDTSSEDQACGGCGIACPPSTACWEGQCVDAAAAPRPKLIVSLTADDSYEDQFRVMTPILEAHGMRGTLYVSSGRIDVPNREFLTTDELQLMQALGHEIGSHGLMHQHLVTTKSMPDRIRREICDSRVDLLARGYAVRSFSYPFGENDGLAESLVAACGYTSGRGVGTIGSGSAQSSDSAPPAQPFMIRAASSVNQSYGLEQIQALVENAESAWQGPGIPWIVLNFHRFCPLATCNPGLAWDTTTFADFVRWLDARRAGGTIVRTISQVASGPLKAGVESGTPVVLNGDMESYLGGEGDAPDCWLRGGSGSNTATWARVPGRSGHGQQVILSDYRDGSKSLIQDKGPSTLPDYRSCSTPVVPGRTYTFQCWYRSDVSVSLTFYRNSSVDHNAVGWMTSSPSPPSPREWALKSYRVTVPTGFTSVSFGPYVSGVCETDCMNGNRTATLIVDDCSVTEEP